jgi:hypothetical protein
MVPRKTRTMTHAPRVGVPLYRALEEELAKGSRLVHALQHIAGPEGEDGDEGEGGLGSANAVVRLRAEAAVMTDDVLDNTARAHQVSLERGAGPVGLLPC